MVSGQRAREVRHAIRTGAHTGLAPGAAQGNVAIIPAAYAADCEAYCRANWRPCPLLAVGQVSARYPDMYGTSIHVVDPAAIGIADLSRTDYGDPVKLRDGEVPVFWACGVTSQPAVAAARLPPVIAHAPVCMLITDRPHAAYARAEAA